MAFIHYYALVCSTANKTLTKRIVSQYNHCGSVIYNCYIYSLDSFEWPEYDNLVNKIKLLFLHKVIQCNFAPMLFEIMNSRNIPKRYALRNKYDLQIQRATKVIGTKSFSYWAPRIWNALPAELKCISSHNRFSQQLTTFLSSE
jgi:hypothetical protein